MPAPFPLVFPFPFSPGGLPEKYYHPAASHWRFPYYFSDNDNAAPDGGTMQGINFRNIWWWQKDLLIYYGDLHNEDSGMFLQGWCSRWDVQDYSIIVETWLKKEDVQILREHIRPGAVKELKRVIFSPRFYDSTWTGRNTIRLVPNKFTKKVLEEDPEGDNSSNLYNMRRPVNVYPKTITEHPIESDKNWISVKLECYVSGTQL